MPTIRTNLYVDGFNLYYGAAKDTRLRWVDVIALAQAAMPGIQVHRTRYFTALVKSSPADPQQTQRQQTYIRALETLPNLTVHKGRYQYKKVNMMVCQPPPDKIKVFKTEEKGTDVNIATYMLVDAFRGDCDQLVVITNDSDLAEPIRIINTELNLKVTVLNPHSVDTAARITAKLGKRHRSHPSWDLQQVAHQVIDITSHGQNCHMSQAQLPHTLHDATGIITIPPSWA